MKKLIYLLISLLFLSTACQNSKTSKEENSPSIDTTKLVERTLEVEGMTCTGCEQTIQAEVEKLNGIQSIAANHKDSIAVIHFDSSLVDIEAIISAIESKGYVVKRKTKDAEE